MRFYEIKATIRVSEQDVREYLDKEENETITDADYLECAEFMWENDMCEYDGVEEKR